jgi:hypothetical protein
MSSFASEEEVEEGRKVPGPVKSSARTRSLPSTGGRPSTTTTSENEKTPLLPTPASTTMGSSIVSEPPEAEVGESEKPLVSLLIKWCAMMTMTD